MNHDYFWLTEEQFDRLEPCLPTGTRGERTTKIYALTDGQGRSFAFRVIPLLLEIKSRAPGERTHVHVQHHAPDIHR